MYEIDKDEAVDIVTMGMICPVAAFIYVKLFMWIERRIGRNGKNLHDV